jgi:hypothetical protein
MKDKWKFEDIDPEPARHCRRGHDSARHCRRGHPGIRRFRASKSNQHAADALGDVQSPVGQAQSGGWRRRRTTKACTHKRADVGFWGLSGNLLLDQSTTGLTQAVIRKHSRDLPMGITDRAMEAWYHPSIA